MNRRRSRRRRRSSRRRNGLWIALAAAAAALFLSVQPGQQFVRFLTDLIDPPEWIIVLDAGHDGTAERTAGAKTARGQQREERAVDRAGRRRKQRTLPQGCASRSRPARTC